MPSGKKDIYGNKSKALYKAGTITAELAAKRAAIANRDPERARRAMEILKREGTTSAAGGRPATKVAPAKMPAKAPPKVAPAKMPNKATPPKAKPAQITRTTTNMRPTPMGKMK
jgi:hypothetical protein